MNSVRIALLVSVFLLLPWVALGQVHEVGRRTTTVTALAGIAPTACAAVGDTVIDSSSGLVWICTDAAADTFRNAGTRHTLEFHSVNAARATHFDGTFCIGGGSRDSAAVPATCGTTQVNFDRAFHTPHNWFIGTCWAYVYGVTGTFTDGVDSFSIDWRINRNTPAASTDVTPALTVTADLTWTAVAVNTADPYADASPTTQFLDLRPNLNTLTDADASITDFDIAVFCDVTEWD